MITKLLSRDVSLILIASFFYMACPMMVTPLIAGFSESLGASAVLMGFVGGMMNIVSLCCRPFVGNLADKVSKYRLSTIGSLLMIVACIGYVLAPSSSVIVLARIVNGIGFSCCSVCMATWISNLLPKERIGAGMGLYGTMNALAMAIAPALGISLYGRIGYRVAFIVATALAVMVLFTIQCVHDKGEVRQRAAGSKHSGFVAVDVLPVAAIIMLFAIPYCATQSFLVSYIAARGLAVSAGFFFPLYAVVLLVLRLSLANWFDKKPFLFFLGACSVCMLASIAFLTDMENDWLLFCCSSVYGRRLRHHVFGLSIDGYSSGWRGKARPGQQHLLHWFRPWHGVGANHRRPSLWSCAHRFLLSGAGIGGAAGASCIRFQSSAFSPCLSNGFSAFAGIGRILADVFFVG